MSVPAYTVTIGDRYRSAALALSPTHYWSLAELSGAVAHDIGSSPANGTISGAPAMGAESYVGSRAISFDGATQYIGLSGAAATGTTWWLAFWITPNRALGASPAIIIAQYNAYETRFDPSSGQISYGAPLGTTTACSQTLTTLTPYFVVLNSIAGAGTFYVNGVAAGSFTGVSWTPNCAGGAGSGVRNYGGLLSEVAIGAGASLTATQIAALYAARTVTLKATTLRLSESANGASRASFTVQSIDGSYRPGLGAEIRINEDTTRIWGGFVQTCEEQGWQEYGTVAIDNVVTGVSYATLASRRFATETVPSQTLKTTLTTNVLPYLSPYGVTLDAAQANGPTLDADDWDGLAIKEALDRLSKLSGYAWEIDGSLVLRMYAPGSLACPFDISTANGKARGDIRVRRSRNNYTNSVIVKYGDSRVLEETETFTGTGAQVTWTLGYRLAGFRLIIYVNGVLESLVTTPDVWTYSAGANTITRSSAVPLGQSIVVTYDAQFPDSVTAEDTTEQAANGLVETPISEPTIFDATVAQALADATLALGIQGETSVTYLTAELGARPGMTQTITCAERGLSGSFTVNEVDTNDATGTLLRRTITAVQGTDVRPELVWSQVFLAPAAAATQNAGVGAESTSGPAGPAGPAGTNGTNGTNGSTWRTGNGAPGGGTGVNGDFYIDTSTRLFYGPKAAGSWPAALGRLPGTGGFTGSIWAAAVAGNPTNDEFVVLNGLVQ